MVIPTEFYKNILIVLFLIRYAMACEPNEISRDYTYIKYTNTYTHSNYETKHNLICLPCPTGTYVEDNNCAVCPNGYRCNGAEKVSCPVGTFSPEGHFICSMCPPGTFNEMGECTKCPRGTYNAKFGSSNSDDCKPCTSGHFSDLGLPICYSCDDVWAFPDTQENLDQCFVCESNEYLDFETLECKQCNLYQDNVCYRCGIHPGEECPLNSDQAVECPIGTYNNGYQDNCSECPDGSVPNQDQSDCVLCPSGTFALSGNTICQSCLNDKYSENPGSDHCEICPTGYQIIGENTGCKTCGQNNFLDQNENCVVCPNGTVSPDISIICTECIVPFTPNHDKSECILIEINSAGMTIPNLFLTLTMIFLIAF